MILAPTTGIISLHFNKNRNLAYGLTLTGISMGAVVLPIGKLSILFPRICAPADSNLRIFTLCFMTCSPKVTLSV